ncbi:MAG: hypothetical protein AB1442_15730 [Nitrospirota bacterium]
MKKLAVALLALLVACTPASPAYLTPVEAYLTTNIQSAYFGGVVFCAYDLLDAQVQVDNADVYVWALCVEFTLEGEMVAMQSGASLPVALHMQKAGGHYTVISNEVPGNGTDYWPSIQRIFPPQAIENMCEGNIPCYNERAERLQQAVEEKAEEYYGVK